MNVSDLMEAMSEAGAPMAAIILAVRAIEEKDALIEARRAGDRERKRRQRGTVTGQSRDTDGTVTAEPPSLDKETPPRPPKENNPNPRENRERVRAPKFSLPSDIPEVEWDGFEEMRKRIGKPMTDRARGLAISELRKLADAGFPPGDVLNHCTMNSYQGIFPPKDSRNGRQQSNRSGPLGPSLSAAERFASFGDVPAH